VVPVVTPDIPATVQRDGLFVGHGAPGDMNADIAQPFLVALYPAWTSFFDQLAPR
jgi:hypothetical protein